MSDKVNRDKLLKDIDNHFDYHKPANEGVAKLHELVRKSCKSLAFTLINSCPCTNELMMAITAIEDAMMWSNAAIARHQDKLLIAGAGEEAKNG